MSKPTELVQGTLDLLILKVLALEPMHGWAIARRIRQMSERRVQRALAHAQHVLREIEEGLAAGLPLDEARLRAWRTLGAVDQGKEECRDTRGVTFVEVLRMD